ncbi:MAG: archease [Bacteroidota bacterium]
MGFEEIPHTADWAVHVWAGDMAGLLAESARAMSTLAGVITAPSPRLERIFDFEATDRESQLVYFLSELLYLEEQENLAFDQFDIALSDGRVHVRMEGAPITSYDKIIKAVTWHNLKIKPTKRGLEVQIVFDV